MKIEPFSCWYHEDISFVFHTYQTQMTMSCTFHRQLRNLQLKHLFVLVSWGKVKWSRYSSHERKVRQPYRGATEQGSNEVWWRPGKKQVWRPHVRTWDLSEANILYWKKYLRHCWDFSAPPAVIRRSRQWFGAPIVIRHLWNCAPLAPISLRPATRHLHYKQGCQIVLMSAGSRYFE